MCPYITRLTVGSNIRRRPFGNTLNMQALFSAATQNQAVKTELDTVPTATFALEFYPHSLAATDHRSAACEHVVGSKYNVRCNVVFTAKQVWVMDFGLLAYQNHPAPRIASKGTWLAAEVYLGIDPFFYFEELHTIPKMPELRYDFRIREILLETTPWLTNKDADGRNVMTRDESRRSYSQVAETNAWEDDGGHAHYILQCELINGT